jgi:hypothetical protein
MIHVTSLRCGVVALAFAAGLAGIAPVSAETLALKAELKGSNEVPPNDAKGSGSVTLTLDTASKKLSWNGTMAGLSGNPTAAHFHGPAEAGKNAGVLVPIRNPGPQFEGSAELTDAQMADLLAGRLYVNIHTAAHPGGELRGQVVK